MRVSDARDPRDPREVQKIVQSVHHGVIDTDFTTQV